jgi:hypothetical protein
MSSERGRKKEKDQAAKYRCPYPAYAVTASLKHLSYSETKLENDDKDR